jgi:hypothetical protein
MCQQCDIIEVLFKAASKDAHKNYYPVLRFLQALEEEKYIELYAGDCLLEDAMKILESEQQYTVCHYFQCKSCKAIYFLGACIRGVPIFKKIENIEQENLNNMISGNIGTYYNN